MLKFFGRKGGEEGIEAKELCDGIYIKKKDLEDFNLQKVYLNAIKKDFKKVVNLGNLVKVITKDGKEFVIMKSGTLISRDLSLEEGKEIYRELVD